MHPHRPHIIAVSLLTLFTTPPLTACALDAHSAPVCPLPHGGVSAAAAQSALVSSSERRALWSVTGYADEEEQEGAGAGAYDELDDVVDGMDVEEAARVAQGSSSGQQSSSCSRSVSVSLSEDSQDSALLSDTDTDNDDEEDSAAGAGAGDDYDIESVSSEDAAELTAVEREEREDRRTYARQAARSAAAAGKRVRGSAAERKLRQRQRRRAAAAAAHGPPGVQVGGCVVDGGRWG
jgi:hypothetical protein